MPHPDVPGLILDTVTAQVSSAFMTDRTRVLANQRDGLGLGFTIRRIIVRRGQPIPLHFAIENIAANKRVAEGLCRGVTIGYFNVGTQVMGGNGWTPAICDAQPFYHDTVPLPQGKLVTYDLTTRDANLDLEPGLYILNVSWQSFVAGPETYLFGPTYSVVGSTGVVVAILP